MHSSQRRRTASGGRRLAPPGDGVPRHSCRTGTLINPAKLHLLPTCHRNHGLGKHHAAFIHHCTHTLTDTHTHHTTGGRLYADITFLQRNFLVRNLGYRTHKHSFLFDFHFPSV